MDNLARKRYAYIKGDINFLCPTDKRIDCVTSCTIFVLLKRTLVRGCSICTSARSWLPMIPLGPASSLYVCVDKSYHNIKVLLTRIYLVLISSLRAVTILSMVDPHPSSTISCQSALSPEERQIFNYNSSYLIIG